MTTTTERTAHRVCSRCVMDTSDPEIVFDEDGRCNHCREFLALRGSFPKGAARETTLENLVATIRASGRGKRYDCVVGVSGGIDSTFVAFTVKRLGLRPLAIHVDNGWNSELAVANIERALENLDIDLHTHVIDWEQFRELQIAFLRASVSDAELPTDHCIRAVLVQKAMEEGVQYMINGRNLSTEGILPWSWTYSGLDWKYLRAVHRRCGQGSLSRIPKISLSRLLYSVMVKRLKNVGILDYVDYTKSGAMEFLKRELDWRDYGGKHYESIYTRFFQAYILPRKFGIDKRKAHLSVLVCNGEITRDDALTQLADPPDSEDRMEEDKVYVCKKLGLSIQEFDEILAQPPKSYKDYPNHSGIFMLRRNPFLHGALRGLKRVGLFPSGFAEGATAQEAETTT